MRSNRRLCLTNMDHITVFTILIVVALYTAAAQCCLRNIGRGAAKEASEGIQNTAKILSDSLVQASNRLEQAIRYGSDAIKETVAQLVVPVTELVQNIEFRINSGDLAHIGADATENLKDALVKLSENWNLALDSADLRGIGAEAAKHLSDAIQNIRIRVELAISIDDNTRVAVGYIALAGGIGFAVLLIALLLGIRACRSCTLDFCLGSVEGYEDFFYKHDADDEDANRTDPYNLVGQEVPSMQVFKLNNIKRIKKINNV